MWQVFLVPREDTDEIKVKLGDFGLAVDLEAGPVYTYATYAWYSRY